MSHLQTSFLLQAGEVPLELRLLLLESGQTLFDCIVSRGLALEVVLDLRHLLRNRVSYGLEGLLDGKFSKIPVEFGHVCVTVN